MSVTRIPKALALIAALLAVMALAAVVACGSQEPATAEIDEAQLSRIVSRGGNAESQPAPQPQVSSEEIQSMISMAMKGMSESQVSAGQIQAMVQDAVSGAAQEGASRRGDPEDDRGRGDGRHGGLRNQRGRPVRDLDGRDGSAGERGDQPRT